MGILDSTLEFSDAQAMAASSAAVTQSTNVHSLGASLKDAWGSAKIPELGGMYLNLAVSTVVNASTIITAKLMSHTAATSIKSGTQIASIVLPAAAAAGTKRSVRLPFGQAIGSATTPHIGVTYTVSGAKCTTGAVNCWLGAEPCAVID